MITCFLLALANRCGCPAAAVNQLSGSRWTAKGDQLRFAAASAEVVHDPIHIFDDFPERLT
jgi:hypothetical protein